MSKKEKMISIQNLSIGYENYIIQSNLNLDIYKGEMVCLVGKNGCGKSTLLKTMAGIIKNISGKIVVQNQDIRKLSQQEKAKKIALVLTQRPNITHTTILDVVKMGQIPFAKWYQPFEKSSLIKVEKALEMVNIIDQKQRLINELSDGEIQRVMIAKALAQDTPIILLDEPTAHLDLPNRVETMILLKKLAKHTQKTIIIATHELNLALQTSDKIWLMTNQQKIIAGTPDDLIKNKSFNSIFNSNLYQLHFYKKGFELRIKE